MMHQKRNLTGGFAGLVILLCLLLTGISCRKADVISVTENHNAAEKQTAKVPAAISSEVSSVMNKFREESQYPGFSNMFKEKYGEPAWGKSLLLKKQTGNAIQAQDMLIVPVLQPGDTEVRSYMEATLSEPVQLYMRTAAQYKSLAFGDAVNPVNDAERAAVRFMMLNQQVFGFNTFRVTDNRLFNGSASRNSNTRTERTVTLGNNNSSDARLAYVEICVTITITTTNYHCTHTGSCSSGTCDGCYLCVSSSTTSNTTCEGWWEDDGGGGGGGTGGGTGGTGGGGGGGGTGGGGNGEPCNGSGVINARVAPCGGGGGTGGGGGGGGWVPVPDEPDPCTEAQPFANILNALAQSSQFAMAKNDIINAGTDGNEHAITFGRDASNNITASPMVNGGPTNGTANTNWPNGFADMHNHPNPTAPSAGDMYNIIGVNNAHVGYNTRMVIAPNGSVYALVVTNLAAANAFKTLHPPVNFGYGPDFPSPIFDEYNDAKQRMTGLQGMGNQQADEMAMAYIMDKYGMGMALLKQDASGNFKRLRTMENMVNGTPTYTANNCQ